MWWSDLCVNLTGPQGAYIWLKLFLGVSVIVFLDKISIWTDRVSKTDWEKHTSLGEHQSVEDLDRTGHRTEKFSFCLTAEKQHWSSPALSLELTPLVLLVLRPSDLVWNYTPGLPGFLACTQQTMGLLSFPHCVRQFLIINLFIDSVSLGNPA